MIRKIQITNYKSIPNLTLDLGRVTVLIGANGSGKSNILEAIALASAASQDKLDNEFLVSRGIRVTETRFMRSAYAASNDKSTESISVSVDGDGKIGYACEIKPDESASFAKLEIGKSKSLTKSQSFDFFRHVDKNVALKLFTLLFKEGKTTEPNDINEKARLQIIDKLAARLQHLSQKDAGSLPGFLVYAPENSALRTFQSEGQILPLGIKGEGLFSHLKALNSSKNRRRMEKIKECLKLIDWFENFNIPEDLDPGERSIRIRDRYLPETALFDQRSANEGFLFLLFYVTLFTSPETPAFFSIDNIDSSLNPKLCTALLQQIAILAKEFDKQVILTTHNPAVLDGLDLNDDDQRLFVVERNKAGHTRARRVDPPKVGEGQVPVSLSEAFMRGYIGGLPKNF